MRTFSIMLFAFVVVLVALNQQYTTPLYDGEVRYLPDADGDLRFVDVQEMDWSKEALSPVNFGYSGSAYWFYIPLPAELATSSKKHIFEIDFPTIDSLEVYLVNAAGQVQAHYATGTDFLFETRPLWDDDWIFPLEPGLGVAYVYVRAATSNSLQMPIRFYEWDEFFYQDRFNLLFWGGFYGVVLVMALYSFLNGLVIRDRLYAFYGAYVAASALTVAALNGHGFMYVWPSSPGINALALSVFPCMMICFGVFFVLDYLELVRQRLRLRFIAYGMMVVAVSTACLAFVLERDLSFLAAVETVFFSVALLVFGAVAVRKRHYLGWYFLVGWTVLLLGSGMFALNVLGLLPFNTVTIHSKEVGSVFEIIMLSLGMSAIYHHEKEERNRINGAIEVMKQRLQQRTGFVHNKSGFMEIPRLENHLQDIRALDRRIHQEMGRMLVVSLIVVDKTTRRPDHVAQGDCLRVLLNGRITVFPFKTQREGLNGEVTVMLFPLHNKFEAEAIIEQVEQWNQSLAEQYDLHFGYAISHLTEKYEIDYIEESLHYLEEAVLQRATSYSIEDTLGFSSRQNAFLVQGI